MRPERWKQVSLLADAALELPLDERLAFVERSCENDHQLRSEIVALLDACERANTAPGLFSQAAHAYVAPVLEDLNARGQAARDTIRPTLSAALSGRYTIEHEIGHGGMATVFRARDERHERVVAIKVLHPELARELGAKHFLQEIRRTAQLNHPHIVQLLDSGEADRLLFFVMPHMDGGTLRQRLSRESQLPIPDAITITRIIAEALDHAHRRGLIHRDVKPENILFTEGEPYLADFGIARATERVAEEASTSRYIIRGTFAYMSPEQASGQSDYDGRSDVFSLGCVLYEMLAGVAAFTGPTPEAVIAQRFTQRPRNVRLLRPSASTALSAVLMKALQVAPADRYRSAGELARALDEVARQPAATRLFSHRHLLGIVALTLPIALVVGGILLRGEPSGLSPSEGGQADRVAVPQRIAVLYFDDLSADRTLEHVANGLTEDLINDLSQVRGLHVISPNGVRPYRQTGAPLDSIANALEVGTIVGGSVARSGQMLRLSVRLIDASTGQQLLSRVMDEPWTELFALQDKLSTEVARFLRERLGREIRLRQNRQGTTSIHAWEAAQHADELARGAGALIRRADHDSAGRLLWRAESLFHRAEQLDSMWITPTVGRGWLAYSFSFLPAESGAQSDSSEQTPPGLSISWLLRAVDHASRALRRQSDNPEALALRGEMRQQLVVLGSHKGADTLIPAAEADLSKALASRPDFARAWWSLGSIYYHQGRFVEAVRALETAHQEDAFLEEIRSVIALLFAALLGSERFDDARAWCAQAQETFPDDPRFAQCELIHLGWTGRGGTQVRSAWQLIADIERRDSLGTLAAMWTDRRLLVAAILARSGMRDSARAVLVRTRAGRADFPPSFDAPLIEAYVRVMLGEPEAAVSLLTSYLNVVPQGRGYVRRIPWYRQLHADADFLALVGPGP